MTVSSPITLQDEYRMLESELRQNRQIQLQSFSSTPIWVSLFFGLALSSDNGLRAAPSLILIPIPLVLLSLLLILNRRRSSDIIITYFRTAYEQHLASDIGWNYLLPKFRKNLADIKAEPNRRKDGFSVPQRFDFIMAVWLSYLAIAGLCIYLYRHFVAYSDTTFTVAILAGIVTFLATFYWILYQSKEKSYFYEAWIRTLDQRRSESSS